MTETVVKTKGQVLGKVTEALNTTILFDSPTKELTFLAMCSAFGDDPLNVIMRADAATGKSWIALECAKFFPRVPQYVERIDYSSPMALIHEFGTYNKEDHTHYIDWNRKILLFKDQPHTLVLDRLKTVMSHDERTANIRITEKTKGGRNITKHAVIEGIPAIIFCTAQSRFDEQLTSRCILLSPSTDSEKLKAIRRMQAEEFENPVEYQTKLLTDPTRKWLEERLQLCIKHATGIRISIPDAQYLTEQFNDLAGFSPRGTRDYRKVVSTVKTLTWLNFDDREKKSVGVSETLLADQSDVDHALGLWEPILKPNLRGISPSTYEFYQYVVMNAWQNAESIDYRAIRQSYYTYYGRPVGRYKCEKLGEELQDAGLIIIEYQGRKVYWEKPQQTEQTTL